MVVLNLHTALLAGESEVAPPAAVVLAGAQVMQVQRLHVLGQEHSALRIVLVYDLARLQATRRVRLLQAIVVVLLRVRVVVVGQLVELRLLSSSLLVELHLSGVGEHWVGDVLQTYLGLLKLLSLLPSSRLHGLLSLQLLLVSFILGLLGYVEVHHELLGVV